MPCSRSLGGLLQGGVCSRGEPGGDPPETATAAGGTHPTGMHSCLLFFQKYLRNVFLQVMPWMATSTT